MNLFTSIIASLSIFSNARWKSTHPSIKEDSCRDLCRQVLFFLYTRNNPENPQQLWIDNKEILDSSYYDTRKATKFMTHGWLNTHQGLNCRTVKQAFLDRDDYNVIVVDWGEIAKLPYIAARARVSSVGGYIAKMIDFLENQGCSLKNMSLVGHSLGAHVMGLAGYQATNEVGHVVGLDPAAPLFENVSSPERGLSPLDAHLVEVVHTDAGDMGLVRRAGYIDYYVNGGGPDQPGCGSDPKHYCAHDRAYELYAEAVRKNPYEPRLLAVKCNDWETFLRGDCDNNERIDFADDSGVKSTKWSGRSYYLRTAESAPFGLGFKGTRPAFIKTFQ